MRKKRFAFAFVLQLLALPPFASRCPIVEDLCRKVIPPLEAKQPGHLVACHRVARADSVA